MHENEALVAAMGGATRKKKECKFQFIRSILIPGSIGFLYRSLFGKAMRIGESGCVSTARARSKIARR
jgi:hypothetical protein